MLAKINPSPGLALSRLAGALALLANLLAPALRGLFGQWRPPAWLRLLGRGLSWLGGKLQAYALATLVLAAEDGVTPCI